MLTMYNCLCARNLTRRLCQQRVLLARFSKLPMPNMADSVRIGPLRTSRNAMMIVPLPKPSDLSLAEPRHMRGMVCVCV